MSFHPRTWPRPSLPPLGDDIHNSLTTHVYLDSVFGQHPDVMLKEPGRALLVSAVRQMDKTVAEYNAGRDAARTFAEDMAGANPRRVSSIFRATDRIETCIGALHRTLLHLDALKAEQTGLYIDRIMRRGLESMADVVNTMRDKIEHADEQLRYNPSTEVYAILVLEENYLRVGASEISYRDLADWIAQTFRVLRSVLP